MGQRTKIEWCDSTWNPVTGCLHGCEYCYARRIAKRFSTENKAHTFTGGHPIGELHELDEPAIVTETGQASPYPFGFEPTLYRYRLFKPTTMKEPQTIFVCSMADLFGAWVPDGWIEEVFAACGKAPQHRYLFLTKNPGRYSELYRKNILPNSDRYWFGATFDHSNWSGIKAAGRAKTFCGHDAGDFYFPEHPEHNRFVSFEPLLYDIGANIGSTGAQWHIIGAETGNRKRKVKVEREWVEHIVEYSDRAGIPVFMKDSLLPIVGEENMRREFPWR